MSSYNIIMEALLWKLETGTTIYPCISTDYYPESLQEGIFESFFDEDGLRQLSKVNLLKISLPNGKRKYTLTTIEEEQKRILNLYGIKKLNVPIVV